MMKRIALFLATILSAGPAVAASKNPFSAEFYSLTNSDFIVSIAFLLFMGILVYFGVPKLLGKMLDDRAAAIKAELEEARALREEAQALLATFERKQKDVQSQADAIVDSAQADAKAAAEQAKADIASSVERRLTAATEQIASAEADAMREVRHRAIAVAVGAASDIMAKGMKAADADKLIDAGIAEVEAKLH
ncbi:MAG: ATP F0F1 synthase subunit B [Pseudomonadota bacterium]